MHLGTIAGHTFAQTPGGRCCVAYSSQKGGTCGMAWLHVRTSRFEDISQTDLLAHHGRLTEMEYNEIRTEVDREEADIWEAVIDAASAGSR